MATTAPLTLDDLRKYQVPSESMWEAARFVGDGYDRGSLASKYGWKALYSWGQDGWDLLDPPYYVLFIRDRDGVFEMATNCEGDSAVYSFPTEELRSQAIDQLAFWGWSQAYPSRSPWAAGFTADNIPNHLRGPYRPRT